MIPAITGATGTISVIQTVPGQHAGAARKEGTTGNSHTGHCAHTSESNNVEVRNVCHRK